MALRPPTTIEEVRQALRNLDRRLAQLAAAPTTKSLDDLLGFPDGVPASLGGQIVARDKHGNWVVLEAGADGLVAILDSTKSIGIKYGAPEPASHTIVSHSDTTATGPELETLTDGSNADSLHAHANSVLGPASATNAAVALFDGTTGKLLKANAATTRIGNSGSSVALEFLGNTNNGFIIWVSGTALWLFSDDMKLATTKKFFFRDTAIFIHSNADGELLIEADTKVTVQGRDVATDGTKLDTIEGSADVTDASNVDAAGAVMNSDFGAKGDILSRDGSAPLIVGVGTNDQVLTAASVEAAGVKWADAAGGGDTHPMVDTTELVKGSADATKIAKIECDTNIPTSSTVIVAWPAVNLDLKKVEEFQTAEYDNGNSGANKTIDWRNGRHQKVTINASCTFAFTNPTPLGMYYLRLLTDGTGGYTLSWPASSILEWVSGAAPAWSTAANAKDLAMFHYHGSTKYWGAGLMDFG